MASDSSEASGTEPVRSVEIELKFDVDADTPLPDWSGMPGVASVDDGELRELDARYLDTPELTLGYAGYALRRRRGGPDEGWHIKGPRIDGARVELGWPLGPEDEDVPEAVRAAVSHVTDAAFGDIARIRNHRTAFALRDAAGVLVAEFVDDHVTAIDVRTGIERAWREWELELGPAAPDDASGRAALFTAAADAVAAVGGRPAASLSKLGRALGY